MQQAQLEVLNRVDEAYPQRVDAAVQRATRAYDSSCIAQTQQAPEAMEEVDEAQLLQYENMEQLLPTLPKRKVEVLLAEEEGLGGGGGAGAAQHGRKGVQGEGGLLVEERICWGRRGGLSLLWYVAVPGMVFCGIVGAMCSFCGAHDMVEGGRVWGKARAGSLQAHFRLCCGSQKGGDLGYERKVQQLYCNGLE